jgi:DNA polymerase III subunit delta'
MAIVRLAELLGPPAPAEFLRGVVARGRFANAYLFTGPAGVGKGTAALAFARALLCERRDGGGAAAARRSGGLFDDAPAPAEPDAAAATAGADDACDTCPACVRSARLQHPDLKFLFPVSGEEREMDETVGETMQALRDDPFFVFQYERAASIRLSLTRELIRELAYHPFEAARRVVVVRDADRMRGDQYSALLKSIEEPGASTVWVLTTSRLARLPATIPSRCQRVRFAPLPEGTIREYLEQRLEVPNAAARMLAALSGGSLARALVLRDDEPLKQRDQALALLDPALAHNPAALWKQVQIVARQGRTHRETLRRTVEFQQLWLRDLLRAGCGVPREELVNRDRYPILREEAARVTPTEVRRRLMVLEELLRAVEGNVAPELALFSALMRVAGEPVPTATWPPHPTPRWNY